MSAKPHLSSVEDELTVQSPALAGQAGAAEIDAFRPYAPGRRWLPVVQASLGSRGNGLQLDST